MSTSPSDNHSLCRNTSPANAPLSPSGPGNASLQSIRQSATTTCLYRAVVGYTPNHDGEIDVKVGDIIACVKHLGNGWSLGKNESSCGHVVGIFPSQCIVPWSRVSELPRSTTPLRPPSTLVARQNSDRVTGRSNFDHVTGRSDSTRKTRSPSAKLSSRPFASPAAGIIEDPRRTTSSGSRLDPLGDLVDGRRIADDDARERTRDPTKGHVLEKPHLVVKPNQDKVQSTSGPTRTGRNDSISSLEIGPVSGTPTDPVVQGLCRTGQCYSTCSGVDILQSGSSVFDAICRRPGGVSQSYFALHTPDGGGGGATHSEWSTPTRTLRESNVPALPPRGTFRRNNIRGLDSPSTTSRSYYTDYRTLNTSPSAPELSYAARSQPSSSGAAAAASAAASTKYKPILKTRRLQKVSDSSSKRVYYSESESTRGGTACRFVVSVMTALLVGCLVFLWMVCHLDYTFVPAAVVAAVVALAMSVGLSMSRMCRCVTALLLPSLCTARGRVAFAVFVSGFLLSGPVTNVYINMEEISRSMSCSAEQSYNQTMLLLQPFDAMMVQLNRTISGLETAAHNVSRGLKPLDEGLENVELDVFNGKMQLFGTRRVGRINFLKWRIGASGYLFKYRPDKSFLSLSRVFCRS